jgi:hypothetical protein
MRKAHRVRLQTSIAFGDLAQQLVDELERNSLTALIRDIDAVVADYDFTKKLRDYFVNEIKAEDLALGKKEEEDAEG